MDDIQRINRIKQLSNDLLTIYFGLEGEDASDFNTVFANFVTCDREHEEYKDFTGFIFYLIKESYNNNNNGEIDIAQIRRFTNFCLELGQTGRFGLISISDYITDQVEADMVKNALVDLATNIDLYCTELENEIIEQPEDPLTRLGDIIRDTCNILPEGYFGDDDKDNIYNFISAIREDNDVSLILNAMDLVDSFLNKTIYDGEQIEIGISTLRALKENLDSLQIQGINFMEEHQRRNVVFLSISLDTKLDKLLKYNEIANITNMIDEEVLSNEYKKLLFRYITTNLEQNIAILTDATNVIVNKIHTPITHNIDEDVATSVAIFDTFKDIILRLNDLDLTEFQRSNVAALVEAIDDKITNLSQFVSEAEPAIEPVVAPVMPVAILNEHDVGADAVAVVQEDVHQQEEVHEEAIVQAEFIPPIQQRRFQISAQPQNDISVPPAMGDMEAFVVGMGRELVPESKVHEFFRKARKNPYFENTDRLNELTGLIENDEIPLDEEICGSCIRNMFDDFVQSGEHISERDAVGAFGRLSAITRGLLVNLQFPGGGFDDLSPENKARLSEKTLLLVRAIDKTVEAASVEVNEAIL